MACCHWLKDYTFIAGRIVATQVLGYSVVGLGSNCGPTTHVRLTWHRYILNTTIRKLYAPR